mmetsp:Transcript_33265/g.94636  ORF Transcript_33265/g.94636 Transcript_33265/m.94636 type:complete len:227 (+) Transcript_33265:98-778(+)|eukprot:CAMPEP_0176217264 /NCGR_PEP_ID=MMETSP0121_2-20121125/17607_1 /TAXON_ID=160619 /ORGANISM="Kryptoperidinium foliaceum, Strain CCMP 1326" /LENGTH=226 /DNA_ID=CAMNT_0017556397 /DNA_START=89 /DNA_END=769 /DNA_ORIENTATION=-
MACFQCCLPDEDRANEQMVHVKAKFVGMSDSMPEDVGAALVETSFAAGAELFRARLAREFVDTPIGLDFERVHPLDILHVERVEEGDASAVGVYNSRVTKERRVQVGDYIMSVNGVIGLDAMLDILERRVEVTVVVARPHEFDVTVAKNGKPLGLELKFERPSDAMFVSDIDAGHAVDASGANLKVGDRIVEVNGRTSFDDMAAQLRESECVHLRVSRACRYVLAL